MSEILLNASRATVAPNKLTEYLLSIEHKDGKAKAKFLMQFGFNPSKPEILKDALLLHVLTRPVVVSKTSIHGEVTTVKCEIESPDGRNPCIQTVWIINHGETSPKFVTLIPRS